MPEFTVPDPQPIPTRTVNVTFPAYAKRTQERLVAGMLETTRQFWRLENAERARVIELSVVDRPEPQSDLPTQASIHRRPVNASQIVDAHERRGFLASNEAEYLAAQAEAVTIFTALRI